MCYLPNANKPGPEDDSVALAAAEPWICSQVDFQLLTDKCLQSQAGLPLEQGTHISVFFSNLSQSKLTAWLDAAKDCTCAYKHCVTDTKTLSLQLK